MATKFAQSELDYAKQKAGYHRHDDTLPLFVYCSKRPGSKGLAASFLVDIPTGWKPPWPYGLHLLIFPQPLGRALKNQNAAPTTPPCFCRRQRSSLLLFESCTAHCQTVVIPVDIPSRWEPRAKQQPTGLIAYGTSCRRPVRALYRHQNKKTRLE